MWIVVLIVKYIAVMVVIDDEWGTSGKVVDMLVFAYYWYGWSLLCGVGGPSISLSMIEYDHVDG